MRETTWFPHDKITGEAWRSPRLFITAARIVESLLEGLVKHEHHKDADIWSLADRQFLGLLDGSNEILPEWHDLFGTVRARVRDDD